MKLFCDISATLAVATLLAATDFASLRLNPLSWFSADTTTESGGTMTECPTEDGKFAISCDADNVVSFTTASGNHATQDIVSVTLALDATIAAESQLETLPQQSCFAVALCEKDNSGVLSTNFVAWTGSGAWLTLNAGSDALPAAGESYELIARLDNRESATKIKLAFKRQKGDEIVLKNNTDEWLVCSQAFSKNADFVVGFFGDGAVASLIGRQYEIQSEVIVVGDVPINIPEADMKKFEASKGSYASANAFLEAEAKTAFGVDKFKTSTLKVAEAYALGLVKDVNGTMAPVNNGEITIKADAQANVADGIRLEFLGGVTPRTDTDTAVTYQLQGSVDGNGNWKNIGEPVATMPTIPLDNVGAETDNAGTGKYRYFKVVTKLSGGAQ